MNFSREMLPGLTVLFCGAAITFLAGRIRPDEQGRNKVKLIGVLVAAAGAALIFLV